MGLKSSVISLKKQPRNFNGEAGKCAGKKNRGGEVGWK
jgi:hypothetical protein